MIVAAVAEAKVANIHARIKATEDSEELPD
jgi:hypothetical protein